MLTDNIISYENNVMLAAILLLLLVILFVLLLHFYARWFLADRTTATLSMARVLGARLSHEHTSTTTHTYDITSLPTTQSKGLDPSEIDSIPSFIYSFDSHVAALECAICLSVFEERETGKILPGCSHAFHVECIDMWLHSHSTCPICRAEVVEVEVVSTDKLSEDHVSETSVNNLVIPTAADDYISVAEFLVEIIDDHDEINNEVISDQNAGLDCSLRRMLSRCRSENRVHLLDLMFKVEK